MTSRGINAGYELVGIHKASDPVPAMLEAEAIFMGGGNTFRLLDRLYRFRLLEPIRERVRGGVPYLGISAGTNVACPTMKTTNDMPIVQPPSLDALGLVPFQVNAHYYTGSNYIRHGEQFVEHFGETRDDRLREFHEENETPVVGLWEGGILRVENGRMRLIGAPARIFRRGQPPVDVTAGSDLSTMLELMQLRDISEWKRPLDVLPYSPTLQLRVPPNAATRSTIEAGTLARRVRRKVLVRIIPLLFLLYIISYLDRANAGFAKLRMQDRFEFPRRFSAGRRVSFTSGTCCWKFRGL